MYNTHIFIPIFIFLFMVIVLVFWIIVVIMGWVCFTVIMGNVCFQAYNSWMLSETLVYSIYSLCVSVYNVVCTHVAFVSF